jgi:hypothetical protein
MGTEYKIDRANFKRVAQREVEVTKVIYGQPVGVSNYESTKSLLRNYNFDIAKGNFDDAGEILKELVKREPLNSDFYSKLIMVNMHEGRRFAACNSLKYVQTYLVIQPGPSIIQGMDCQ